MSYDRNDFYRDQCNTCGLCHGAMDASEEIEVNGELYCEECAEKIRAEIAEEADEWNQAMERAA